MWLRVLCLVGYGLAIPVPQELTLKDFATDARSNGDRSLGGDQGHGLLISAPYRQVRRQGRRGENTNIKFPTLTVENPNILSNGAIQKVANENGPVFNNVLSTKDIEGKIKQINNEEEKKILNEKEQEKKAEQILNDIEMLEEVDLLEKIVNLDLQNAEEELIEIGEIDLNTPEITVEGLLPQTDILYNDEDYKNIQSDILYSDDESGVTSDVLYSDDDSSIIKVTEVDIPVVVEEEIVGNLEEELIRNIENLENIQPLIDMIDVKVPTLLLSGDEEAFAPATTENVLRSEGSEAQDTSIEGATLTANSFNADTSVPEKDFGLIQEV